MATIYGVKIYRAKFAYGLAEAKPLKGFPAGMYRIRLRPNEFVTVYVKSADGIRRFYVKEQDDHWVSGPEIAQNIRGVNQ
jgi:hypothetical protein